MRTVDFWLASVLEGFVTEFVVESPAATGEAVILADREFGEDEEIR